jgi:hypothetical protein
MRNAHWVVLHFWLWHWGEGEMSLKFTSELRSYLPQTTGVNHRANTNGAEVHRLLNAQFKSHCLCPENLQKAHQPHFSPFSLFIFTVFKWEVSLIIFFNGFTMVADHLYKVVQTVLISLERLSLYCKESMCYTHRTQLRLQGNHPDTHTKSPLVCRCKWRSGGSCLTPVHNHLSLQEKEREKV